MTMARIDMNNLRTANAAARWWVARSATFSYLSGEDVTHGEVVLTHVVIIGLLLVCGLAEWIGG